MITKEKIITGINSLQDPISIDDVLDKILLLEKIETGLEQSEKGRVIPDNELDKWIENGTAKLD
ncbi:MAG: hypothetical protein HW421_2364 [Ignavibacteria bacterium]|nr:hypothetical protein [Ignavibacteria bacterium]